MTSQFPSMHPAAFAQDDALLPRWIAPARRRPSRRVWFVRVVVALAMAVVATAGALGIVAFAYARAGAAPLNAPPLLAAEPLVLLDGWTAHRVELEPVLVDLAHLGQHTHANWVVFELPFDTTAENIRHVEFRPRALRDTNVAALPTAIGCIPVPTLGAVEGRGWAEYTATGTDGTGWLSDHPLAPTRDTGVFAINVPTRVANAAACWDAKLRDRSAWRLEVSWQSID